MNIKEKQEKILSVIDCSNCTYKVDEKDWQMCNDCTSNYDNWVQGENIDYSESKFIHEVSEKINEHPSEFKYILRMEA